MCFIVFSLFRGVVNRFIASSYEYINPILAIGRVNFNLISPLFKFYYDDIFLEILPIARNVLIINTKLGNKMT